MKLSEILTTIKRVANENNLSEPYICGGIPRDKLMNRLDNVLDVDITTGDEGSNFLGKEFALKVNAPHKVLDDGHIQVMLDKLKIDFSSNFRTPHIDIIMKRLGVKNPSELLKEQYSRDFTCNSLIYTLDLKTIKDPLGVAVKDIKNKIVKTCLPPKITLGSQHKRVVRVFYIAAKLGFDVDNEIVDWISENPKTISDTSDKYVSSKLVKAFKFDEQKTVNLLTKTKTWSHIPVTKELQPYWIKYGVKA